MTGRRRFSAALVTVLTVARGHCAQSAPRVHHVGFINLGTAVPNAPNVAAFRDGLKSLGYVEGKNLAIDFRWADQDLERLPGLVKEMLAARPHVILSGGGLPTVLALKASATTVPVVFVTGDPIAEGIVSSMARPEGTFTGFAVLGMSVEGKRMEYLRQALPGARQVALIWNPSTEVNFRARDDSAAAAAALGIRIWWYEARDDAELDRALAAIQIGKVDALMIQADPVLGFRRRRIVEFAMRNRLPGVYFWREFVQDGGLMSFGTNMSAVYSRAATYVDKILRGAKPSDLPIEQPTLFELVINRTTAKSLGVALPKSMLANAEVID